MNKLFVFNKGLRNDYLKELESGYSKIDGASPKMDIGRLTVDYLISNSIDIVISNGLTREWYFILKGLNIVTITLDELQKYYSLADIVIDYKSEDNDKYFTGKQYSLVKGNYSDFGEVANLITKLEWDSAFWGFPVAYLSSRCLTENIMLKIDKVIKNDRIRLIEYLCNCHDKRSVKVAEKNLFHFTDIRLSFEKKLTERYYPQLPDEFTFGKAVEGNIGMLREISKDLYLDSRYFFDENFDEKKATEFYQGWVEKAVVGQYDDECYCMLHNADPVGFCTVKYGTSGEANIGLFGLSKKYQGKGLGRKLLHLTFNALMDKKGDTVFVVTQGRNYSAQRIYQSVGFRTKATELWYHKWLY